jgi:PPIC-type PPIASE domain
LAAVILYGCGKEAPKKEYVAKVNDSYLTRADLASMIDSGSGKNFYKNEVIRDWINKELLYQEAKSSGILNDAEFKKIKDKSEKELVVTFLLNKVFEKEKITIEPAEIKDYYEKNKDNFKLFYNAFLINLVQFNDEDKAIAFREKAFGSGWNVATEFFKSDSNIVYSESSNLVYEYEIQSADIVKVVRELLPGEISIVINDGSGDYYLVQLLQRYDKGTIPPFEIVQGLVRDRFIALKKEQFITNYIKELYPKNDIEIK